MKKVAKTVRKHKMLILNWFIAKKQFSSGIVEGLNNKVEVITKRECGFRSTECVIIELYHVLDELQEPPAAHRFLSGIKKAKTDNKLDKKSIEAFD